jgi:hypothetical protein
MLRVALRRTYQTIAKTSSTTCEESKYIQLGITTDGLKIYCANMLKEDNTALYFRSFKNGKGIKKLVACMPHDQVLGDWALHTMEGRKWNDIHSRPITDLSRDIIQSMTLWMWQPTYAKNFIYAPEHGLKCDLPWKHLNTAMHTANWWRETNVRSDSRR